MKISRDKFHQKDLKDALLPRLRGKVFHVTTAVAFDEICASGAIKPNKDGRFEFGYPQSGNSYFRKRGYVCVFDLRTAKPEQINDALDQYRFLNPRPTQNAPIHLFLAESCFDELIPWNRWKEERAWGDMVVPYVEAGYPGEITLSQVESALCAKIDNPLSLFVSALESLNKED